MLALSASTARSLGETLVSSLGESACPDGFFQSCLLTQPGKPAQCSCVKMPPPPSAVTLAKTSVNNHWGLIAAGCVSAFVIYKFVL